MLELPAWIHTRAWKGDPDDQAQPLSLIRVGRLTRDWDCCATACPEDIRGCAMSRFGTINRRAARGQQTGGQPVEGGGGMEGERNLVLHDGLGWDPSHDTRHGV